MEGQEPAVTPAPGQEPGAEGQEPAEPRTFDEGYVKKLREEAAGWRTKAQGYEQQVKEFEDSNKTEQEKLNERLSGAETRATQAEDELLRFKVAVQKKLPVELIGRMRGGTQEELEADAEELLKLVAPDERDPIIDFGPGVRTPVSTERSMDALIRQSAGRR